MSFLDHYFVEGEEPETIVELDDGGAELTRSTLKAIGPKSSTYKQDVDRPGSTSSYGSGGEDDDNNPEPNPEPKPEPKPDPKPRGLTGRTPGGFGYLFEDGHQMYDVMESAILGSTKYKDVIVDKDSLSNKKLFQGYVIKFKPWGENPEQPEKFRTMWIIKNKEQAKKKPKKKIGEVAYSRTVTSPSEYTDIYWKFFENTKMWDKDVSPNTNGVHKFETAGGYVLFMKTKDAEGVDNGGKIIVTEPARAKFMESKADEGSDYKKITIKQPTTKPAPKKKAPAKKGKPLSGIQPEVNGDWSGIVFLGRISFEDALHTFMTGLLKGKKTAGLQLKDVLNDIKWGQNDVNKSTDPYHYSNVKFSEITSSDLQMTKDAVSRAIGDEKNESASFSDFYEYDMVLEGLADGENIVDKGINNMMKGMGGSIAGLFSSPPTVKIKDPSQLEQYFPNSTSFRVKEGAFMAVNSSCTQSMADWTSAKKDYGIIAQQFLKLKSVYVKKIIKGIPVPPQEGSEADYAEAFTKAIPNVEVDETVQIEFMKIYKTTNGGTITTMQCSVEGDGKPKPKPKQGEEDKDTNVKDSKKNVSDQGDQGDPKQGNQITPDANSNKNPNIGEAEDVTNLKDRTQIYVVGADSAGADYFEAVTDMNMPAYIKRFSSATASDVKDSLGKQAKKSKSLEKQAMGSSKEGWKRREIPNLQFISIYDTFNARIGKGTDKAPGIDKLVSGPVVKVDGKKQVKSFTTKGNGKAIFINDGPGTDGRIVITKNAWKAYQATKADEKNIGRYKLEGNENE